MSLGLIGKKIGMTRMLTEHGESLPVTVLEVSPNRITQVKTERVDGYNAVQVTTGTRRATRVTQPMAGHFAKAGVEAGRGVWEFRLPQPAQQIALAKNQAVAADADSDSASAASADVDAAESTATDAGLRLGADITVALFSVGQKVDVAGRTIGKGFAGVIKRHGFRGGRASHGNSKAHRLGGSIGNAQDPGRVYKGKKMAGHMGARNRVQQGLEVIRVDIARNLLLIKGSIPGAKGADVIVRPSVKAQRAQAQAK